MSQLKIKNGNSWESIPAGGIGVPSGGSSGDFLAKSSSTDYATEWKTPYVLLTGTTSRTFNGTEYFTFSDFDISIPAGYKIAAITPEASGAGTGTANILVIGRNSELDNIQISVTMNSYGSAAQFRLWVLCIPE